MSIEVCESKKRYRTREKAWEASVYFFTQYGWYGTPYQCKYCSKYHLTNRRAQQPSKQFVETFNKWYGSEVLSVCV